MATIPPTAPKGDKTFPESRRELLPTPETYTLPTHSAHGVKAKDPLAQIGASLGTSNLLAISQTANALKDFFKNILP